MVYSLGTGNPNSRSWQGHAPSKGSREESFLASLDFWWLLSSLVCGCDALVSAFVFPWPPLPCLPLLSLMRTFVIGFRALLDNLGPSLHIMILKLITTAETAFPNEVTFTGSRN